MAISNGKEVENVDESHIGCLMCNLLTSKKGSDDLTTDFHGVIRTREQEWTMEQLGEIVNLEFLCVFFWFC